MTTRDEREADMVTTQEALAMLHVSRPTLYRIMEEGLLAPANFNPLQRKQKRLLFRRADVERLLRDGRTSG